MPSKRKFWRACFEVEVLLDTEEDPHDMLCNMALPDVLAQCEDGGWSGQVTLKSCSAKSGRQMAKLLEAQASEPEFFGLTPDGEDVED